MSKSRKKQKQIRFYEMKAAHIWAVEHEEALIGEHPVPFQEVEIYRINPKTKYILETSYIHMINLN
jgi:hypothetical protein